MAIQITFKNTHTEAGYSVTKSRLTLFELLNGQEPQSMRDLIEKASGVVNRASVYRNIELFEKLGIVQRLYIGWKYRLELTGVYSHHHHHISCIGCSRVVPLSEHDDIERLIDQLAKRNGMTAQQHQLEIQGYCDDCSRKAGQSTRPEQ